MGVIWFVFGCGVGMIIGCLWAAGPSYWLGYDRGLQRGIDAMKGDDDGCEIVD